MLHPVLRTLLTAFVAALIAATPVRAFETAARAAWVYDFASDTVLLEKNADAPMPPASMSKLMTLYMLYEALRDGRVSLDTRFAVSTRAKSMGGSTMFLNESDRPTVEELIHGIIINSGNDACVVVAEGLAGSEDSFAAQMTERARSLGMMNSTFANASGWPDPMQLMSMRDLGELARRIIVEFPEYYPVFAETEYNYKDRSEANKNNRNPLLGMGIGADGMKTGHTQEAGYGLVGSVMQGERRIVFVISGLDSEADRAREAEQISAWAFRQFLLKTLFAKDAPVASAPVWLGAESEVSLVAAQELRTLVPAVPAAEGITAEAIFDAPITAPIAAGQVLGELVIEVPGIAGTKRVPLIAANEVAAGGVSVRLRAAFARLAAKFAEAVGG
ncbi:D-alanyl-D-alanine carboxypeptidase family protein [Phaeovulum sp.]|uniref:D-alanyl-D-alanine carboxypeptidase family protein n=1 Tax=Phaeovulum sp. TaxID=2934796 RepID=UPI0035621BE1